ncbi:MAG: hypothetical protein ACRC68_04690 [Clostridium sp.]
MDIVNSLNYSKNNNFKYFKTKTLNVAIPFKVQEYIASHPATSRETDDNLNIISYRSKDYVESVNKKTGSCSQDIDNLNVISCTSYEVINNIKIHIDYATIDISIYIKILYTTKTSTSLNVLKYNFSCIENVMLQNKIDGFNLEKLNNEKKLNATTHIKNISYLGATGCELLFSLYIISYINITPLSNILYIVNEDDNYSNLYTSNSLYNNFSQLSLIKKNYQNICFSTSEEKIYYINNSIFCESSIVNPRENQLFIDRNLKWFINIKKDIFITYKEFTSESCVYIYNLSNSHETLLYKCNDNSSCQGFSYKGNILCFLVKEISKCSLITLKINENIIYSCDFEGDKVYINPTCEFITYFITNNEATLDRNNKETINSENRNNNGEACMVFNEETINESRELHPMNVSRSFSGSLYVMNINNKEIKRYDFPIADFNFIKLSFQDKNLAIILGHDSKYYYIVTFNIETLIYETIYKTSFIISDIDVDSFNNIIFTSNEIGLYNLYKIKPGYYPSLCLRLFSKNISLLVRK